MTATVYYDSVNEIALLSNTFLNSAGVPADPTTTACTITEPSGAEVVHTFAGNAPADVVKVMTGKYTLSVACSPSVPGVDGLWGYEWTGTGNVSDVQPGTWRVMPQKISQLWYVGLEEMKDRLGITEPDEDYALQAAIAAATGWINSYCVVPFTMILTADLRWVPAGDLVPGQEIIGVDEEPVPRPGGNGTAGAAAWLRGTNHSRRYRRAEVLAVPRRLAECVRLVMLDGREVTCAADHRWMARQVWPGGHPKHGYRWTYARDITPGDEIAAPLRVWPEETSFEAGWVSGLFDGEGYVTRETALHSRLGVSQNPGLILDGIIKYLENAGIPYNRAPQPEKACVHVEIARRWAAMEVLGRIRPRRLLPKAADIWEDKPVVGTGITNAKVIAAEPAGIREVISLSTSTGTYIAEGLISHNCGRHFNRVTEARTFQPSSVWLLEIDDLVDDPSISVSVDQAGTGTFDQHWTRGTDYVLRYGAGAFNPAPDGIARPFRQLQVVQSGKWLPFTWPYSHLDRVQILGPWGWPSVPWAVTEACRMLSADVFKYKDAPFGIAGVGDLGVLRANANPWIVEQLQPYVCKRKVGV